MRRGGGVGDLEGSDALDIVDTAVGGGVISVYVCVQCGGSVVSYYW